MSDQSDDGSAVEYQVREAVAVFTDPETLETAIEDLQMAGITRPQINLMASDRAAREKLGYSGDVHELAEKSEAPTGAPVSRYEIAEGKAALVSGLAAVGSFTAIGAVVATGGTLAAIIAAAIGAGGVTGGLGGLIARALGQRHAENVAAELSQGGLLLWVEVRTPEQENKALDILRQHSGRDVHVHELTRRWGDEQVPMRRWQPDPFLSSE